MSTSLRGRLLRHLMPALLLSWVLGSAVALFTASYFTQRAYDRSMLDDAQLVAAHLRQQDGRLVLEASVDDLHAILYDATETLYFAVLDGRGRLVAGTHGLRPEAPLDDSELQYADMRLHRSKLKAVVLTRQNPLPYRVIVAVTTGSRDTLLNSLFIASIVPQAMLLLALVLWLRRLISRELQPLSQLRRSIESRDSDDLSPLPRDLAADSASSDVRALSGAIDGLLKRVAQSMQAQREFAGNVAHELRTPLAGVRIAASYGLAQPEPAQWREQLEVVLRGEQRASHLIDQLLALALAHEASANLQLKPLLINDCVRELALNWLPRADQAGFELVASGLDTATLVMADQGLLEGLVNNLLDNALRYGRNPEGGENSLSIVLSRVAGEVWLSVIDCGPGIAPEQNARLRQRWRQGETASRSGVGLGLAICDRFAQLMRARLVLDAGFAGSGLRASVVFEAVAQPH